MKNKNKFLVGLITLLLLTCGCSNQNDVVPPVVYDYDTEDATTMIDEVEWLCAWLQSQDTISRKNAEELIVRFNKTLQFEGENIVTSAMTDAADWENSTLQTISLGNSFIQPTIYHEDISIVSAKEERSCRITQDTGDCTTHFSSLTIRKEYTGDNETLKDWYLEYVFVQYEHDGNWQFSSYNGTYNVEVDLPLNESFNKASYINRL